MFKIVKANIVYVILILFMIIPVTRNFIQQNIYKLIGVLNPVETIDVPEQKNIGNYSGKFINVGNEELIEFSKLEDKVIFISFWATWCPPCKAEMPSIQSLFSKYSEKVEFLLVSNENLEVLQPFLKDNAYTLPVYNPLSSLPKVLEHKSIPTTFIISKKGDVVVQKTGAANWDSKSIHRILDRLIEE